MDQNPQRLRNPDWDWLTHIHLQALLQPQTDQQVICKILLDHAVHGCDHLLRTDADSTSRLVVLNGHLNPLNLPFSAIEDRMRSLCLALSEHASEPFSLRHTERANRRGSAPYNTHLYYVCHFGNAQSIDFAPASMPADQAENIQNPALSLMEFRRTMQEALLMNGWVADMSCQGDVTSPLNNWARLFIRPSTGSPFAQIDWQQRHDGPIYGFAVHLNEPVWEPTRAILSLCPLGQRQEWLPGQEWKPPLAEQAVDRFLPADMIQQLVQGFSQQCLQAIQQFVQQQEYGDGDAALEDNAPEHPRPASG